MIQPPQIDFSVIGALTVLCVWGVALLLIDAFFIAEGQKRVTGYLALAGLAVAALVGLPSWGQSSNTFSGMVQLDGFSQTLIWIFLLAAAITIVISLDYLPRHDIEKGEYYPLVLFATAGMVLLAQSTNLIVMFLAIELVSIPLYILAGFAYPRVTSEEAAMKYLLLGAFASGFFVYGLALIYGQTGTVQLFSVDGSDSIASYLDRATLVAENNVFLFAGSALILVTLGFKVALVPFHNWTPDVYEGSPTPIAAFMSVGTKGAAFAALLRFLVQALPNLQAIWMPILAILAALTMIVGNIGALKQLNVKRMLAYSSVGHAGYITLAVITGTTLGTNAFLFYILAYTLTNLGAFAVLIALEKQGESAWSLEDLSGLWQRQPLLAVAMAIFMLSLAGVPPTMGFVGKFYIFSAAWEGGLVWLAAIGVITSAISAFFYLRIIARMFMYEPTRAEEASLSRALKVGLAVAAVAVLLLGLIPTPIIELVNNSLLVAAR